MVDFLTGDRLELIEEYICLKKFKGKFVIPLGINELKIKSINDRTSKNGNEMVVLTITKDSEDYNDRTLSYHPMTLYYTNNRLTLLKEFIFTAFSLKLMETSISGLTNEISSLKGAYFKAIICHQKRLVMKDGSVAERRYIRTNNDIGLPIISYEPQLWKYGPKDIPLTLKQEEQKLLLLSFNKKDQQLFDEVLLTRYINKYGTY